MTDPRERSEAFQQLPEYLQRAWRALRYEPTLKDAAARMKINWQSMVQYRALLARRGVPVGEAASPAAAAELAAHHLKPHLARPLERFREGATAAEVAAEEAVNISTANAWRRQLIQHGLLEPPDGPVADPEAERDRRMVENYRNGLTAQGNANDLNARFRTLPALSRNAVIGRLHRAGFYRAAPKKVPPAPRIVSAGPVPKTCQWPIGNPGDRNFRFCSADTAPGRPYCGDHCAAAYCPIRREKAMGISF